MALAFLAPLETAVAVDSNVALAGSNALAAAVVSSLSAPGLFAWVQLVVVAGQTLWFGAWCTVAGQPG